MVPNAYTPVSTVRPNASATPRKPIPSDVPSDMNFAANTALPQPPNTNQKVPMNSAASRCSIVGSRMRDSSVGCDAVRGAFHAWGERGPVVSESFLYGYLRDGGVTYCSPIVYSSTGLERVTTSGSVFVNGKFGRSSTCMLNVAASTSRE